MNESLSLLNVVLQFNSKLIESKEQIQGLIFCAERRGKRVLSKPRVYMCFLRWDSQIIENLKIMYFRTCCNSFWFSKAFKLNICKRGGQHHSQVELHYWWVNWSSTVSQCYSWYIDCSQVWKWRVDCSIWLPRTIQGWYIKHFGTVHNYYSAKIRQWTL